MALRGEKLYTLREVIEHSPIKRAYPTMYLWAEHGLTPEGGGEKVTLETIPIAGRRHTSVEAIDRFLQQVGYTEPAVNGQPELLLQVSPSLKEYLPKQGRIVIEKLNTKNGKTTVRLGLEFKDLT